MAELLRNPEKMSTLRDEIKHVLEEKGQVEESDMGRLPYLQAVVKETLRLHPPAPFLVPQKADVDLHINGYLVPKRADILVNVWASGRDPNIWTEADVFMPERFLNDGMNYIGNDFKLIPFGAGRRICPGYPLARKMVHLMLATFVGKFGWRGVNPNMDEDFGLTLHKAVPVEAFPTKI